jgi:purine-binding chemotaxis protein CheW
MDQTIKIAVFKIGQEDFGIEVKRVVEILNMQKAHTIPELPDFLSGVITVRGEVIPLLDLRKRFSVKSPEGEGRIIIVRYDSEKIGLLVDDIKEITSLGTGEIITPPSIFKGVKKKYLSGLGKKDERIIILLNIDDLLTSEEKIFLKKSEGLLEEDAESGKSP